jgi:hypothetical protein
LVPGGLDDIPEDNKDDVTPKSGHSKVPALNIGKLLSGFGMK